MFCRPGGGVALTRGKAFENAAMQGKAFRGGQSQWFLGTAKILMNTRSMPLVLLFHNRRFCQSYRIGLLTPLKMTFSNGIS